MPGMVSDRHFCCLIGGVLADTFPSACHISPSCTARGPESTSAVCKQIPLKSLETTLTASVPESIMSGMLFLLFIASLFQISPCSCEVRTCVYELLVAKIRECGVLANPFFHYSLGCFLLLFCAAFLSPIFVLFLFFFFHLLPSMAMSKVCSSAHGSQALKALQLLLNKKSVF